MPVEWQNHPPIPPWHLWKVATQSTWPKMVCFTHFALVGLAKHPIAWGWSEGSRKTCFTCDSLSTYPLEETTLWGLDLSTLAMGHHSHPELVQQVLSFWWNTGEIPWKACLFLQLLPIINFPANRKIRWLGHQMASETRRLLLFPWWSGISKGMFETQMNPRLSVMLWLEDGCESSGGISKTFYRWKVSSMLLFACLS